MAGNTLKTYTDLDEYKKDCTTLLDYGFSMVYDTNIFKSDKVQGPFMIVKLDFIGSFYFDITVFVLSVIMMIWCWI